MQSVDNSDAERRRLKALKALKERLKKPGEEDEIKSQWSDATSTTNLLDPEVHSASISIGSIANSNTLSSQISDKSLGEPGFEAETV